VSAFPVDNDFDSPGPPPRLDAMTSPRELDRQVRQNRNDIDDVYDLLDKTDKKVDKIAEVQQEQGRVQQEQGRVQQEHGNRLAEMQHTLELHDTKLSLQASTLGDMRHQLRRVEDNQRKHNDRLEEIAGLLRKGQ
jgi:hypothetical protein